MFSLTDLVDEKIGNLSGIPLFPQEYWSFVGWRGSIKLWLFTVLRRRNHFIVNGYPTCLKDEETVHLLYHYHFAYLLWVAMLEFFDMS